CRSQAAFRLFCVWGSAASRLACEIAWSQPHVTSLPERHVRKRNRCAQRFRFLTRSEEHTSELQSRGHLVCRLLLEKKKMKNYSVKTEMVNACQYYLLLLCLFLTFSSSVISLKLMSIIDLTFRFFFPSSHEICSVL